MPIMSIASVTALPMRSRSSMTLAEIGDSMTEAPPQVSDMTGGWASTSNDHSNLGVIGAAPPPSSPIIEPATGELPERLCARFYFWAAPPSGFKDRDEYDPAQVRKLAAVDAVITRQGPDHIGILWSTRNRTILNRRGGPIVSLQSILKTEDDSIEIDRFSSHLKLEDTDLFLWLSVQQRDNPQIDHELRLDQVSGISGQDASYRTAELRAGVDFGRPNFLTAVAEADTLGPIEISFVQSIGSEIRTFKAKVHLDGGVEVRRNEVHIPGIIDSEELALTATQLLAFHLVPRINSLYVSDAARWSSRREEVIEEAMRDLADRYSSMRAALQQRKLASP